MLLVHIVIALSSLVVTGAAVFFPTLAKLRISYSLVALTLITGTYLVVSTHAEILSACTTGLIYLGIAGVGIVTARYKLALQTVNLEE